MFAVGRYDDFSSFKIYMEVADILALMKVAKPHLILRLPERTDYWLSGVKGKNATWTFDDEERSALAHRDKFLHFYTSRELFCYKLEIVDATTAKAHEHSGLIREAVHPGGADGQPGAKSLDDQDGPPDAGGADL